uniref:Uncharacterized protein n=1 Tax=Gouania willdenowi TaxID=441366 RepID=A0A8C5ESU7_GOUWI
CVDDEGGPCGMSEETLDYFVSRGLLPRRDAAEMSWSHAVNSRKSLAEALTGIDNI